MFPPPRERPPGPCAGNLAWNSEHHHVSLMWPSCSRRKTAGNWRTSGWWSTSRTCKTSPASVWTGTCGATRQCAPSSENTLSSGRSVPCPPVTPPRDDPLPPPSGDPTHLYMGRLRVPDSFVLSQCASSLSQVYHDSEEGQRYIQFYKLNKFPYISILDPRTGESRQSGRGLRAIRML